MALFICLHFDSSKIKRRYHSSSYFHPTKVFRKKTEGQQKNVLNDEMDHYSFSGKDFDPLVDRHLFSIPLW